MATRTTIENGFGAGAYGLKVDSNGSIHAVLVNSSGVPIKITKRSEDIIGSAGTGTDGDVSRVYTLSETNSVEIAEVYIDGVLIRNITDYTKDNDAKTITMSSTQIVFDSQTVTVVYYI